MNHFLHCNSNCWTNHKWEFAHTITLFEKIAGLSGPLLHNNYRPQTKLREGNEFTSVCQSFCSRGEGDRHLCEQTPPPRQTSPWTDTPGRHAPGQTPLGRSPLGRPRRADPPPLGRHHPQEMAPEGGGTHPTECILVLCMFLN